MNQDTNLHVFSKKGVVLPASKNNTNNFSDRQKNFEHGKVSSLYVGDLSPNLKERDLETIFSKIGPLTSVKICQDIGTGESLGYGFINFENLEDAEKALSTLNYFSQPGLVNKPLRIMWDYKSKNFKKFNDGNIFLKDLPLSFDSKKLENMFSRFGKILSCKVCSDETGRSLGYGFVNFENEMNSKEAISEINGKIIDGKKIFAAPFLSKKERKISKKNKNGYTNIYIKNILPQDCNENFIQSLFGIFGKITSIFIQKNKDVSVGIAFVNFEFPEDAEDAIFRMNNKKIKNLTLYVGRAKTKFERQRCLKKKFLSKKIRPIEKPTNWILIMDKIPYIMKDDQIISLVVSTENIKNCKIFSLGKKEKEKFGFVWFSKTINWKKGPSENICFIIKNRKWVNFSLIFDTKNLKLLEISKKRMEFNTQEEEEKIELKEKKRVFEGKIGLNFLLKKMNKKKSDLFEVSFLKILIRLTQHFKTQRLAGGKKLIINIKKKNIILNFFCKKVQKEFFE